jgi:hypothetical protein
MSVTINPVPGCGVEPCPEAPLGDQQHGPGGSSGQPQSDSRADQRRQPGPRPAPHDDQARVVLHRRREQGLELATVHRAPALAAAANAGCPKPAERSFEAPSSSRSPHSAADGPQQGTSRHHACTASTSAPLRAARSAAAPTAALDAASSATATRIRSNPLKGGSNDRPSRSHWMPEPCALTVAPWV